MVLHSFRAGQFIPDKNKIKMTFFKTGTN